jgi:hypothetical protein
LFFISLERDAGLLSKEVLGRATRGARLAPAAARRPEEHPFNHHPSNIFPSINPSSIDRQGSRSKTMGASGSSNNDSNVDAIAAVLIVTVVVAAVSVWLAGMTG